MKLKTICFHAILAKFFGNKKRSVFLEKQLVLKQNPDDLKQSKMFSAIAFEEPNTQLSESAGRILNIESITLGKALRLINTSFESFFEKRAINQQNFNFLIKAEGEKRNSKEALNAFEKMTTLNVKPNETTYANIIYALTRGRQFQEAMKYFEKGIELFGPHLTLYNSALFVCARSKDLVTAENIWTRATQVDGLTIDCVFLTNMISVYNMNFKVMKCWELFNKVEELKIEPDDILFGSMIRICAKTRDAEKAKFLYNKMKKIENLRMTAHHYNAIILALASRSDYATEALQMYEEMCQLHIEPTRLTFIAVLEATSKIGDVTTAYNALVQMNAFKIPQNNQTYSGIIKTYASALSFLNLPKKLKAMYIEDSWKIFNDVVEKHPEMLKTDVLNSLVLIHANADLLVQAEESILPLFDKFKLEMNSQTYEILVKAFFSKREISRIQSIFDQLKKSDRTLFSLDSLNVFLDAFIRVRDIDRIAQTFQLFSDLKKQPERKLILFLSEMQNLPDELYEGIRRFSFGEKIMKDKIRTYFPVSDIEKHILSKKPIQRNIVKKNYKLETNSIEN